LQIRLSIDLSDRDYASNSGIPKTLDKQLAKFFSYKFIYALDPATHERITPPKQITPTGYGLEIIARVYAG
jgi:hypothetical protein